MAERITGADFDKKVKNADGLVLLDFTPTAVYHVNSCPRF